MEGNIYFQDLSGIIIAQPLYIFDKNHDINPYLSLTLGKDNSKDLTHMKKLMLNFALPEINKINTIDDFIKSYEDNLPFLIAENTFVYFIAAYLLTGQEKKHRICWKENSLRKELKGCINLYMKISPSHKNLLYVYA